MNEIFLLMVQNTDKFRKFPNLVEEQKIKFIKLLLLIKIYSLLIFNNLFKTFERKYFFYSIYSYLILF